MENRLRDLWKGFSLEAYLAKLGVDGALYKALEFTGDGVILDMADRFSISNMAIEAGAKSGIFAVDEVTLKYLEERREANGALRAEPKVHYSDEDANYIQKITIDISKLSPVIAYPFLPSNGKSIERAVADDIKIAKLWLGVAPMEELRI